MVRLWGALVESLAVLCGGCGSATSGVGSDASKDIIYIYVSVAVIGVEDKVWR